MEYPLLSSAVCMNEVRMDISFDKNFSITLIGYYKFTIFSDQIYQFVKYAFFSCCLQGDWCFFFITILQTGANGCKIMHIAKNIRIL
jgi:hypothetical protein